jgi:hypothetical protein
MLNLRLGLERRRNMIHGGSCSLVVVVYGVKKKRNGREDADFSF